MKVSKTTEIAVNLARSIQDDFLRQSVIDSTRGTGDWVELVSVFHDLYECPNDLDIGTTPNLSHMSDERLMLRYGLVKEESEELLEGIKNRDEVEIADALGDLIYVVVGFAIEAGIDLPDVINEIHASNMTKLGSDGNVIRRHDGKVMKGSNYVKPDIKSILNYRK